MDFLKWEWSEFFATFVSIFAVIDILGSIPLLITLKEKMGHIRSFYVVLISGILMILFYFLGRPFLSLFGLNEHSFAVGGAIVIFLLALEMVLGRDIFHTDENPKAGTLVPIAFPLIAGAGTLTTIMSLKATFETKGKNELVILAAILVNLIVVYIVLKSLNWIQKVIGRSGLIAIRKFFGVMLLAISIQIFVKNFPLIGFH
ncbi:MAG TPA: MarC family protein [Saprospiraceae bacterium]|jgi:multiple antibiotic resistance protein|nr:MarC family protein [Saprospiraceae bacterium]HMT78413.1 MarC family protein [Saprospiraceae bacterium]HQU96660.1 MarC family protein [Saprospiraceae bacterium]HQW97121.1 MarC family protein [Saprospiraceae bacterium]